ncbi:MAG: folate family ECF transporter S component [Ruminococcaceae bacterium]|nr:folate family ECF transporter S component [Oscillospiraceae bacterium]
MARTNNKYVRDLTVFPHPFSLGYWKMAARELTDLRTLIFAALIIAIRVALKQVFIPVGESLSIYIGFIFTAVGGSVYGPVMALIVGTITDLLGFVVAPTGPFNPMFTLVEVLSTFLYALVLYRQKITFSRILLSKLSVNVLANMLLQSWVMSTLYGKAFYVYVVPRIIKNIVMLPFEVIILSVLFGALIVPMIRLRMYNSTQNALVLRTSSYIILGIVAVVLLVLAIVVAMDYNTYKDAFKAFMDSLFGK